MKRLLLRAMFMAAAMLLGTGCSEKGSYPSVSSISGEWLEIKRDIYPTDHGSKKPIELAVQIDDFRLVMNRFFSSPVGSLYKIHQVEETRSLAAIDSAAERLKIAIQKENSPEVFPIVLEIDSALELLRRIDMDLSARSQMNYFQLFLFFSLLVIIVILTLRILYTRLEKAESREKMSLTFSRETLMAQEQERSRIARELHDTIAQDLWRLSFQTDSIDKAADPGERRRLCSEVAGGQRELMGRIRSLCETLVPPDFQRRGLCETLRKFCYDFEQRTGIECQITFQRHLQFGSLDNDTQLQCFRIVQECLANIEKHSGATEASVLVRIQAGPAAGTAGFPSAQSLLISVSDNGRGFSPPDRYSSRLLRTEGHFGLWNMYERAASLSGILKVDSASGEGAIVSLQIPFLSGGHNP